MRVSRAGRERTVDVLKTAFVHELTHATGLVSHICAETWRPVGGGPPGTQPTGT
jgi:hypothetical protein